MRVFQWLKIYWQFFQIETLNVVLEIVFCQWELKFINHLFRQALYNLRIDDHFINSLNIQLFGF